RRGKYIERLVLPLPIAQVQAPRGAPAHQRRSSAPALEMLRRVGNARAVVVLGVEPGGIASGHGVSGGCRWRGYNAGLPWGRSSAGRASRSQCEGREFDPPRLHHENNKNWGLSHRGQALSPSGRGAALLEFARDVPTYARDPVIPALRSDMAKDEVKTTI